jgi:hypothetical protein
MITTHPSPKRAKKNWKTCFLAIKMTPMTGPASHHFLRLESILSGFHSLYVTNSHVTCLYQNSRTKRVKRDERVCPSGQTPGRPIGWPVVVHPKGVSLWPLSCLLITIHLTPPWSWKSPFIKSNFSMTFQVSVCFLVKRFHPSHLSPDCRHSMADVNFSHFSSCFIRAILSTAVFCWRPCTSGCNMVRGSYILPNSAIWVQKVFRHGNNAKNSTEESCLLGFQGTNKKKFKILIQATYIRNMQYD